MIEAKVHGLPDLRAALASIPDKLRKRALRNALAAGAREVQKAARSATPVLKEPMSAPYRKPGTVRKAIRVRTSKFAARAGDVGVYVNVKPLPGPKYKTQKGAFGIKRRVLVKASQRSAKNPNDPFYWRFINFGTKHMQGFGFLEKGVARLGQALEIFKAKIGPAIDKLNQGKNAQP